MKSLNKAQKHWGHSARGNYFITKWKTFINVSIIKHWSFFSKFHIKLINIVNRRELNWIILLWNAVPSMVIVKIHFHSMVHTVGMKKLKSKALFLTFDLLKIFVDMTLIILDTNKFFRSSIVSIGLFSTSGGELLKKTADTLFNWKVRHRCALFNFWSPNPRGFQEI